MEFLESNRILQERIVLRCWLTHEESDEMSLVDPAFCRIGFRCSGNSYIDFSRFDGRRLVTMLPRNSETDS